MRRLHLSIFSALSITGLLSVCIVTLLSRLFAEAPDDSPRVLRDVGALVVDELPRSDKPSFERALARRARRLHASLSVWDKRGRLLGRAGRALPPPSTQRGRPHFRHYREAIFITLDDGRTLGVAFDNPDGPLHPWHFLLAIATLVLVLLLGSYVAARRITRRLEKLEEGVTRFGTGDLAARVAVEGRDEVAKLANAFNRAIERIAGLVHKQRRMLQSASHELRSPLARLRMAFELLREQNADAAQLAQLSQDAERDIAELDELISDLLLAGRLTDSELPKQFAPVALAAIVRDEARRVGATMIDCGDTDSTVWGNARMLKSLTRNLLENAKRYGKDPVCASLARTGDQVCLFIDDQGCLLPEADHERIFEPFYRPEGHREGRHGGVGLGLALVRSIAEHHGGSAHYLVHEGHSRFEVRLPVRG